MEIYYKSIGQNSSLLINFPVDTRGLIHEKDEEAILKMAAKVKEDFAVNLVKDASFETSAGRGIGYEAKNLGDSDFNTYWTTPDGEIQAAVEIDFGKEVSFNRLLIQEFVNLGQRVKSFSLEIEVNGSWEKIAEGTTIGYKRILRFPDTEAQKIRINFLDSKDIPVISEIGVYAAPALLFPPQIKRTPEGKVSITAAEEGLEIYFSTDGSKPEAGKSLYSNEFDVLTAQTVQAIAVDPRSGKVSDVARADFDLPKASWKVSSMDEKASRAIDENIHSYFTIESDAFQVDLGQTAKLTGITYHPMQGRYPSGFIANYVIEVSQNGSSWKEVARGEFSNIANSPIEQTVRFDAVEARHVRLKALKTTDGNKATVAEFGVITR